MKRIILGIIAGGLVTIGGGQYYAVSQSEIDDLQRLLNESSISANLPTCRDYGVNCIDVRCIIDDVDLVEKCFDIHNGERFPIKNR